MRITILLAFGLLLSNAWAVENSKVKECRLSESEIITVGCTYHCSKWVRWALHSYARKMNYRIKIVNLFARNASVDLAKVDALLIPGGADINPKYYTPFVERNLRERLGELDYLVNYSREGEERDPFEYELLSAYFNNEKFSRLPVLGICRGMQMLAVSQKIPLYIDLNEELGIRNRLWTFDRVYVTNPESVIQESVGKSRFWGVQYHHQGLRLEYFDRHRERWPQLEVTAVSNGGKVAEVLEFYERPVLGTQFHPEWTFGKTRRGVFKWLLNRACHKKQAERQAEKIQQRGLQS